MIHKITLFLLLGLALWACTMTDSESPVDRLNLSKLDTTFRQFDRIKVEVIDSLQNKSVSVYEGKYDPEAIKNLPLPRGLSAKFKVMVYVDGGKGWERGMEYAFSDSSPPSKISHLPSDSTKTPEPEKPIFKILTQPISQEVVAGSTATFFIAAEGSPPLRYQWHRNGASIPNAHGAELVLAAVTSADSGAQFLCKVVSGSDTVFSAPALLHVRSNAVPPSILRVTPDSTLTEGGTIFLQVQASGTGIQFQWFKNGAPIPLGTQAAYRLEMAQPRDSGTYHVEVSNTLQRVRSPDVKIKVLRQKVNLVLKPASNGSIKAIPGGPYFLNDSVVLQAKPDHGYRFAGWTVNDSSKNNDTSITLKLIRESIVTGTFSLIQRKLNFSVEGSGKVEIRKIGQSQLITNANGMTFGFFDTLALIAIPDNGNRFIGWEGIGSDTARSVRLTMHEDRMIKAKFAKIAPTNQPPAFTISSESLFREVMVEDMAEFKISASDPDSNTVLSLAVIQPSDLVIRSSGKNSWTFNWKADREKFQVGKEAIFEIRVSDGSLNDTLLWKVKVVKHVWRSSPFNYPANFTTDDVDYFQASDSSNLYFCHWVGETFDHSKNFGLSWETANQKPMEFIAATPGRIIIWDNEKLYGFPTTYNIPPCHGCTEKIYYNPKNDRLSILNNYGKGPEPEDYYIQEFNPRREIHLSTTGTYDLETASNNLFFANTKLYRNDTNTVVATWPDQMWIHEIETDKNDGDTLFLTPYSPSQGRPKLYNALGCNTSNCTLKPLNLPNGITTLSHLLMLTGSMGWLIDQNGDLHFTQDGWKTSVKEIEGKKLKRVFVAGDGKTVFAVSEGLIFRY